MGINYGCGGVCERWNHSICMSACLMDDASRKEFVKKLVAERKAKGEPDHVHGALGTGKVLKPINPGAYAFLDNKPKESNLIKEEVNQPVVQSLSDDDKNEFRRFTL